MAFSIRELEHLSGIKAHTIRIWEQRYNFLRPSRTGTNIRTYSNEELKTLLTVALLNKYGFKISKIDEMLPEQRHEALLQQTAAREEYLVNQMIGYMVDMDNVSFEHVINRYIEQKGIIETVTTLIFQFLQKVGILWQTGHINVAQEHIASNIVRQKVIRAIDALPPVKQESPLFLLLLPEDEHHELGLLFVAYLLKKQGNIVLYLGASVPLEDTKFVVFVKNPSYIYLHLTSFPSQLHFEKYLHHLSSAAPDASILISGSVVSDYKKTIPANVRLLKNLQEVVDFVSDVRR